MNIYIDNPILIDNLCKQTTVSCMISWYQIYLCLHNCILSNKKLTYSMRVVQIAVQCFHGYFDKSL